MATKKIGLDAGHGLNTTGKQTPDGIKEWTLNDKVRDKVVKILKEYDCTIINTDKNDGKEDESLSERRQMYIAADVDAFVSIHHNANTGKWNTATGVETYTDKNFTKEDDKLANLIQKKLAAYTKLKNRGVKRANFAVINTNKVPAVLCEGGFMDGINDYDVITSDEGQQAYAKAVAEGLIEFLKLEKKTAKKEEPAKQTTTTSKKPKKKSNTEIAKEVINGKWGNGEERKKKLTAAGYNYEAVQTEVKKLLEEKDKGKGYKVKINTGALNVRAGAGTKYKIVTVVKKGEVYTIVDEKNGWGKLASGIGWISLNYTKKV